MLAPGVRELLGLPSEEALLERVAALKPARQAAAPISLPCPDGERSPNDDAQAQASCSG